MATTGKKNPHATAAAAAKADPKPLRPRTAAAQAPAAEPAAGKPAARPAKSPDPAVQASKEAFAKALAAAEAARIDQSLGKPAKVEKAGKADKPAKEAKATKARKPKLVRDSFTMPENEYAQFAELKKRLLAKGMAAKKSELLRAGVALLAALGDDELAAALKRVEVIKTGRPAKSAK